MIRQDPPSTTIDHSSMRASTYPTYTIAEIAAAINKSKGTVCRYIKIIEQEEA